jgi:hypothetical protein
LIQKLNFNITKYNFCVIKNKKDSEQVLKLVGEAKEIGDMGTKVILDIAQLRTLEAELAASEVRRTGIGQWFEKVSCRYSFSALRVLNWY